MPGQPLHEKLRLLSKLPEGHVLLQVLDHYRQTANALLRSERGDNLIVAQGFAKAIDQLQADIKAAGKPAHPESSKRTVIPLESTRGV